jgi:peroxiredoxin
MKAIFILLATVGTLAMARPAPTFHGDLMGGGSFSLHEALKPGRSLLVCFWASWCVPCMKELKLVKEKLMSDPSLPLDLVTVNEDTSDTAADIRPSLKINQLDVPVILDPKQEIFQRYHREMALPLSVLISATGDIAQVFDGFHEDEMVPTVKSLVTVRETDGKK